MPRSDEVSDSAPRSDEASRADAIRARTVEVAAVTMRWLESGQGLPVVLLHGIPTGPVLWSSVMPRLRGVRALAWEMVGYAESIPAGVDRDISVARQAEYLVSWMDALGLERVVLAGHDLGGGVAHIAAVRHRERVAGILLTNSIGYDSWPIPSVKLMRRTGALMARLPKPMFRLLFSSLLRRGHDDQAIASRAIERHWSPYAAQGGAVAMVRQVRSLDVADTLAVADELPRLDLPARVVWGAADQFQKVRYGERFARDLRADLQRIPGGRHFTPEDHPDVIAAALNDLVEQIQAG